LLVPSGGTSSGKVSWGCAFYCQSCRREYVNYWANFWPAFVKNCWGPPFAVWCVLAKLGHSVCSACKNFRAQQEPKYGFFKKKSIWACPNSHRLPNFFGMWVGMRAKRGRNCYEKLRFLIFDVFIHSEDICGQSLKMSEIASNFACFWAFWGGL